MKASLSYVNVIYRYSEIYIHEKNLKNSYLEPRIALQNTARLKVVSNN